MERSLTSSLTALNAPAKQAQMTRMSSSEDASGLTPPWTACAGGVAWAPEGCALALPDAGALAPVEAWDLAGAEAWGLAWPEAGALAWPAAGGLAWAAADAWPEAEGLA